MNNNEGHKYEIIRKVILNRQELKHKQERLRYNICAGVCQKSILHEVSRLEYKLKHNLK